MDSSMLPPLFPLYSQHNHRCLTWPRAVLFYRKIMRKKQNVLPSLSASTPIMCIYTTYLILFKTLKKIRVGTFICLGCLSRRRRRRNKLKLKLLLVIIIIVKQPFLAPAPSLYCAQSWKKKEILACKYTTNVECWSQEKDSAWVVHVCMCLCVMTK